MNFDKILGKYCNLRSLKYLMQKNQVPMTGDELTASHQWCNSFVTKRDMQHAILSRQSIRC